MYLIRTPWEDLIANWNLPVWGGFIEVTSYFVFLSFFFYFKLSIKLENKLIWIFFPTNDRRNTFNNNSNLENTLEASYGNNNNTSTIQSKNQHNHYRPQHSSSSKLQQCHSISDIAQECKQRYGSIDTGNVCDVCKKTKFTHSGSGHTCFDCKSRCCVKCAYRYTTKTKVTPKPFPLPLRHTLLT